jgi:hypothetical protein
MPSRHRRSEGIPRPSAIYEPLHNTAHGIEYRMPLLARDESIAVDLHTHGVLPAFWSATRWCGDALAIRRLVRSTRPITGRLWHSTVIAGRMGRAGLGNRQDG